MKTFLIIVFILGETLLVVSQPDKEKSKSEPVDLPEIIITEEAKLFTSTGVKQFPSGPSILNQSELDSLNSLEKQQALLLPGEPLPDKALQYISRDGYIKGSFGRFITPEFEAGYSFQLGEYRLYTEGGLEFSNGFTEHAEYNKLNLLITSDYIAPEKFWLFGGSNTRTKITLNNRSFKLYAKQSAPERNLFNLNASIDVHGNYSGYIFNTGAGFKTLNLSGSSGDAYDNEFSGFLSVKKFLKSFALRANIELDLHSLRGTGMHFAQLTGYGSYTIDNITITVNGGFQSAESSTEIGRGGFNLSGNISYTLNSLFTFSGSISTGLENSKFIDKIASNPYLVDSAIIDFPYNINSLRFNLLFHPVAQFGLSASVSSGIVSRYPAYNTSDTGLFQLDYVDVKTIEINSDAFWNASASDKLSAGIRYNILRSAGSNKSIPYIPLILISLSYERYWINNFGTEIGITYTSKRFADIENNKELGDFNNLWLKANYKLSDVFTIFTYFENLANSNIYIWDGYKERNIFLSLSLLWQF